MDDKNCMQRENLIHFYFHMCLRKKMTRAIIHVYEKKKNKRFVTYPYIYVHNKLQHLAKNLFVSGKIVKHNKT